MAGYGQRAASPSGRKARGRQRAGGTAPRVGQAPCVVGKASRRGRAQWQTGGQVDPPREVEHGRHLKQHTGRQLSANVVRTVEITRLASNEWPPRSKKPS
ncbi:hypothetical protein M8545_03635 [Burkholderia glumae]|nr:hypothetical protein [Burkholderia glumae]MCM2542557.1 hypothetical protein [Burkholderia glumae]